MTSLPGKKKRFNWKRDLPLWGLILPAMIYVLLFRYKSFLGIQIAFKDFRITRNMWDCAWAGLKNFEKLFSNPMFLTVLENTVSISLMKILFGFPAPIIVALMLNEVRSSAYKRTLQTVMYLPHFLSWVVVGSLVCYRRKLRSYRAEMKLLMAEIAEINASMAQQGAAATAATPVDDVPAETAAPSELEQDQTADTAGSASHLERMVVQAVNEGMANCESSVAQIANRLNMGEQTFRRRFVEATGRQPKSFISAIQMGRAASLLSDRNLTIGEVARECGFEEQSAFSHSFKRAFGCAPTEYRANALKQE